MRDADNAIIVYVPGMKPKPPADVHRANLWRCLHGAIERQAPALATELGSHGHCFRVVAWPHIFYPHPKDPAPDQPGLERLLSQPGPEARDIEEARHWHKRLARLVYLLCDHFPPLVDWVVNDEVRETLQDSLRYLENTGGVASRIREMVAEVLMHAGADGRRILLIAHSLGSVIAYDVLWTLTHQRRHALTVDFLTLGSPLGLKFMRHRLLGAHLRGGDRYPANIRRWVNLSAIGDRTALGRRLADDYGEMLKLGLVERITDEVDLLNYFRGPAGLNVHKCYAYMVNTRTAAAVARWWDGDQF